jgi:hypothetical protein
MFMRKFDGKSYRDMKPEEIAEEEARALNDERQYWLITPYDEAVNTEIRKHYTESQEFAILRQASTKPEEYEVYFAYCEHCKTYVKSKREEVGL